MSSFITVVGQLWQRDRAAGGLVMAKSGRLQLGDNIDGQYRSLFNHCDVFGHETNYRLLLHHF